MNLCGRCLTALFPRNQAMTGNARVNATGAHASWLLPSNVAQMVEDGGCSFYDALGHLLPMIAVTTVRGSLSCALHAISELEART